MIDESDAAFVRRMQETPGFPTDSEVQKLHAIKSRERVNRLYRLLKVESTQDAFAAGLDDRDFGRKAPVPQDPDHPTDEEIARREGFDSRGDYDEDGEFIGND